jgi:hypothetical protein
MSEFPVKTSGLGEKVRSVLRTDVWQTARLISLQVIIEPDAIGRFSIRTGRTKAARSTLVNNVLSKLYKFGVAERRKQIDTDVFEYRLSDSWVQDKQIADKVK